MDLFNDRMVGLNGGVVAGGGATSGGWYNSRRQYRSVAFGTWKVSGARLLANGAQHNQLQQQRQQRQQHQPTMFELQQPRRKELFHSGSLDANRNYLVNSGYNTIASSTTMSSKGNVFSNENFLSSAPRGFSDIDRLNGNTILEEPGGLIDVVGVDDRSFSADSRLYASLTRRKKKRLESSVQRVHQRSRSAGNDTVFAVEISPSTSASRESADGRPQQKNSTASMNAFKATKKFFKKIYESATLPGRAHSKASTSSSVSSENFSTSTTGPFFEIRYSSDADDEEVHYPLRIAALPNNPMYGAMLGGVEQHESTPSTLKSTVDDSMAESASVLSKSTTSADSHKTSYGDFHSWNEVFDHLKREITCMRERDAQILADLRQVEIQLQNVKNRSIASSKSDYSLMLEKNNQLRLGDLVESMPL